MRDIAVEVFLRLRSTFFDQAGEAVPFALRAKENTQDDPFDEHLATSVLTGIAGVTCVKAPGALTTPDLVLFRPSLCKDARTEDLQDALDRIVAIEVKKLERGSGGKVARSTGLDYNTTFIPHISSAFRRGFPSATARGSAPRGRRGGRGLGSEGR